MGETETLSPASPSPPPFPRAASLALAPAPPLHRTDASGSSFLHPAAAADHRRPPLAGGGEKEARVGSWRGKDRGSAVPVENEMPSSSPSYDKSSLDSVPLNWSFLVAQWQTNWEVIGLYAALLPLSSCIFPVLTDWIGLLRGTIGSSIILLPGARSPIVRTLQWNSGRGDVSSKLYVVQEGRCTAVGAGLFWGF